MAWHAHKFTRNKKKLVMTTDTSVLEHNNNNNRILCRLKITTCSKEQVSDTLQGIGTYYRIGSDVYFPVLWTDIRSIAECKASVVYDYCAKVMELNHLKYDERLDKYEGESIPLHAIMDVYPLETQPTDLTTFNDFTIIDEIEEEGGDIHTKEHKVRVYYDPNNLIANVAIGTIAFFANKYVESL